MSEPRDRSSLYCRWGGANHGDRSAIVDSNRSHPIVRIDRANGWTGRTVGAKHFCPYRPTSASPIAHIGIAPPPFLIMPLAPDHTPSFLIGPCVRLLREGVPAFFLLSFAPWGREGVQGEGEGRQACTAAQALKPLNPLSIA